jgi:hypothetical protein
VIDSQTIKSNAKKGRDFSRPFAYGKRETGETGASDDVTLIDTVLQR